MTFLPPSESKTERQVLYFSLRFGLTDEQFMQILAETYQAMPSYRLCTAHGVTQLTEGLASKLQGLLEMRAREESRTADS